MTHYYTTGVGLLLPLLAPLLGGCSGSQTDVARVPHAGGRSVAQVAESGPTVEEVAGNYRKLLLVTEEPVLVDPQLAMLCVGVLKEHVDAASNNSGPHAHTSIRIFMNQSAASAFRDSQAEYPVGAVVVKEKLGLKFFSNMASPRNASSTSDGVGGMIKRSPGYDPEHNDWDYFYFNEPSDIEQGRIASCIACHDRASASDYVFGSWANRER